MYKCATDVPKTCQKSAIGVPPFYLNLKMKKVKMRVAIWWKGRAERCSPFLRKNYVG